MVVYDWQVDQLVTENVVAAPSGFNSMDLFIDSTKDSLI